MSGWVEHFNLSADPFSEDPRNWQYYYGADYGHASLKLEHALDAKRGYVVVTGPAGTGKSALVRSVLRRARIHASAVVSVSERAPVAVIDALLTDREPFDSEFSATRKRAALLDMLDQARRNGKPIVCVVEDAHLANSGQLRELVEAINVAPDAPQLLQVVLVGRNDLVRSLQSRSVAALATRVTTRIETRRLKDEELAEYLLDRLEHSEIETPSAILPPAATTAIARHSRGVVALAEVLTRAALERAANAAASSVTVDHIDEVAQIYARPAVEEDASWTRRAPGSVGAIFSSGPAVGLVFLALLVAGAQINMIGGSPKGQTTGTQMAQLADVGTFVRLSPLPATHKHSYEPRKPVQLAQATTESSPLREKFLEGTPYEVQIQPPMRPASDTSGQATPAADSAAASSPTATTSIQKTMSAVNANGSSSKTAGPGAAAGTNGKAPPQATASAGRAPVAPGSRFALQVGAFRELRSAVALKGRLAGSFAGVYVSTVESGGVPLYRVRVGNFATPEETLPLKMQLQASGHPSFRVAESK
jgi:type II secretory pathway predicted ATPase ExeA/cell division protein FtsN